MLRLIGLVVVVIIILKLLNILSFAPSKSLLL